MRPLILSSLETLKYWEEEIEWEDCARIAW